MLIFSRNIPNGVKMEEDETSEDEEDSEEDDFSDEEE